MSSKISSDVRSEPVDVFYYDTPLLHILGTIHAISGSRGTISKVPGFMPYSASGYGHG
jgi:hypothetical protein